MQRESQITNMLKGLEEEEKEQGDGWIRNEENEKPNEVAPDKKLKTSEGQQPHGSFCSPPDTPTPTQFRLGQWRYQSYQGKKEKGV